MRATLTSYELFHTSSILNVNPCDGMATFRVSHAHCTPPELSLYNDMGQWRLDDACCCVFTMLRMSQHLYRYYAHTLGTGYNIDYSTRTLSGVFFFARQHSGDAVSCMVSTWRRTTPIPRRPVILPRSSLLFRCSSLCTHVCRWHFGAAGPSCRWCAMEGWCTHGRHPHGGH